MSDVEHFDHKTYQEIITKFSDNNISQVYDDYWSDNLPEELISIPLEELEIPTGCYGPLKRYGVNTLKELVSLTQEEYTTIRNFGKKYQQTVLARLEELGVPNDAIEHLTEAVYTQE